MFIFLLFLCSEDLYLQFVIRIRSYISTLLSIVVLAASLLPALHAFNHELFSDSDSALTQEFSDASVDCELCDFRVTNADAHKIFIYEIFSPQKETVYSISLAETVNLFPNPLFSLRAPPVVIS